MPSVRNYLACNTQTVVENSKNKIKHNLIPGEAQYKNSYFFVVDLQFFL